MRLHTGRFFGSVEHRVTLDDLRVTRTTHPRGTRVPRHQHELAFLCIVARGGFEERCERNAVRCGEGAVIWHAAGTAHEDVFGRADTECINIELADAWLADQFAESASPPAWAALQTPMAYWIARSIAREVRRNDSLANFAIEALTCTLLAESCRVESNAAPSWLAGVVERLNDEFLHPPRVAVLARDAGVHRSTLVRAFHARFGQTVADYVRELRIRWACGQLQGDPRVTLSDVALRAGFYDQAHFSRAFRRVTGTTPRAYAGR